MGPLHAWDEEVLVVFALFAPHLQRGFLPHTFSADFSKRERWLARRVGCSVKSARSSLVVEQRTHHVYQPVLSVVYMLLNFA